MAKGGRVKRYAKGGLTLDEMIELANRSGLNVESMANVYQHNPEAFRDRLEVMLGMTKGYPGLPFEEEEIAAVTEDVTQQRAEGGTSLNDPFAYTKEVTPATTTRRRGKDILNPGLELAEGYLPSLTQQKDARAARMSTNTALRDAGQSMEGLGQLAEILGTTNAKRNRGAGLVGSGDVSGKTRGMLTEEGTRGLAAAQEQAIKAREAARREAEVRGSSWEGLAGLNDLDDRILDPKDKAIISAQLGTEEVYGGGEHPLLIGTKRAAKKYAAQPRGSDFTGSSPVLDLPSGRKFDPQPRGSDFKRPGRDVSPGHIGFTPKAEFSPAPDAPGEGLAVDLGEMARGITQKAPEVEVSETVVEEGRPAGEDTERSSIKKAISKLGKAQKNALFQALRGGDQRMVLQALQMLPPEIAALVKNRQISREDIKWARGGLASVKKFAAGDPVKVTEAQIDAQIEEWKKVDPNTLPVKHSRRNIAGRGITDRILAKQFLQGRHKDMEGFTGKFGSQLYENLHASMPKAAPYSRIRTADEIYETDPKQADRIWRAALRAGKDPYKDAGEIYTQDDALFMSSPQFKHLKKHELERMTKGKESELLHPATVPVSKREDRGTQFVKPTEELLEQKLRAASPKGTEEVEEVVEETVTEGKSSGFGDIMKMLSPELRAIGAELMQARKGDEWAAVGRGVQKAGKSRSTAANRKVQEAYAEAAQRRADLAEKTFKREEWKHTPEMIAFEKAYMAQKSKSEKIRQLSDMMASTSDPAVQEHLMGLLKELYGGSSVTPATWAQQNFSPDPV